MWSLLPSQAFRAQEAGVLDYHGMHGWMRVWIRGCVGRLDVLFL